MNEASSPVLCPVCSGRTIALENNGLPFCEVHGDIRKPDENWWRPNRLREALIERATELNGCTEGSKEARELTLIAGLLEIHGGDGRNSS